MHRVRFCVVKTAMLLCDKLWFVRNEYLCGPRSVTGAAAHSVTRAGLFRNAELNASVMIRAFILPGRGCDSITGELRRSGESSRRLRQAARLSL